MKQTPRRVPNITAMFAAALAVIILTAAARSGDAPAAADVLPKATLATRIVDRAPDWVVKKGDAEYQHFALPITELETTFHGKVFVAGVEAAGAAPGDKLECALGTFIWNGTLGEEDGKEWHTGWFPLLNTLETADYDADVTMDASDLVNRDSDLSKTESPENMWLFWYRDPENPDAGGYGALCVDGKWALGGEVGQKVSFMDMELEWRGPYDSGAGEVLSGWTALDGEE